MRFKPRARFLLALAWLAPCIHAVRADPPASTAGLVCVGGIVHVESASDILAVTGGVELTATGTSFSVPAGFSLHSAALEGFLDTVFLLDESAVYRIRGAAKDQDLTFRVGTIVNGSYTTGSATVTRRSGGSADISLRLLQRSATQDGLTGLPLRWHLESSNAAATEQHSLAFAWDAVLEPTTLPTKALFFSPDGTTWNGLPGSTLNEPAKSLLLSTFNGSLGGRQFIIATATPPTAGNDTIDRQRDQRIKIHTSTLLANDFNGGASLSVTAVSGTSAEGGTVSLSSGWVFYTPPAGLADITQDSFTYTLSNGLGTGTGTAYLIVPEPENIQANNLTSIEEDPGGGKRPRFACIPGRTYQIYAKTHLADPWPASPTMTVVADSRGRISVLDADATGPTRFYRLVMVR